MVLCVAVVATEVVSQLRSFFAKPVLLVLSVSLLVSIATVLLGWYSLRCWCLVLRFPTSHALQRKWMGPRKPAREMQRKKKSGMSCEDAVYSGDAMRTLALRRLDVEVGCKALVRCLNKNHKE